jgi:germination protein M
VKKRVLIILLAVAVAMLAGSARASATGGETSVYQVWFERGGKLWLTKRVQPQTIAPARAAMQSLLSGPSVAEADAGVHTLVPDGTELLGLSIADGTATVDLSPPFGSGGGIPSVRMRLAQVAYTLTQFASVDRVVLEVNGHAVTTLTGDGVPVPRPMTRTSFAKLLPPILVWNPAIGSHLADAVRVTGTANVFEASLHVRIVNQKGAVIARANVLASCGTGCRGGYSVLVPYDVTVTQLGAIIISDDDTDGNGVPQHQVRVPVVLT